MSCDESVTLLACAQEDEAAADDALGSLDYEEVVEALTAALLGDWEDCTLH